MDNPPTALDIRDPEDLQPLFDHPERSWRLDFGQVDVAEHFDHMIGRPLPGVRAITMGDCWGFDARPESLALLETFPALETLEIVWSDIVPATLDTLASLHLPALKHLEIAGDLDSGALKGLIRAPWWPRLETLNLSGIWLEREMVEALFGGPMPALRHLALDARDAAPLFESPILTHLTELYLTLTDPKGAETFGGSGRPLSLQALERLSLHSAAPLDMARLVALHMPSLAHLSVGQGAALGKPGDFRLGDQGAALIASTWPGLDHLHLHDAGIGPAGARALGNGLHGPHSLTLSFNPLGTEGARALVPCLHRAVYLSLHHCQLDGAAMEALAPALGKLGELHIRGNPIGPRGAQVLARTPMPALERLWLSSCEIGVRGARALASSQNLSKLTYLDLDMGGAGGRAFLDSPFLPEPLKRQFTSS